jgi:MFS family permease
MSELKKYTGERLILSPKGKEKRKPNWKLNILKLYLFNFLMGFHMISGILLPFFLNWGKLTFVEIMILQSFFMLMILVLEIPCGAIADYISRRFSLVLGALSTALAALIYGSFSNIFIFMIGETLFALGNSLISGTDTAFLYDTLKKMNCEDKLTKFAARNRSFVLLGVTLSAPIGSLIGSAISLNLVMTLMFIPFSIAFIISISLKEPVMNEKNLESPNYIQVIKTGFKELRNNKILRILALDLVSVESMTFFLIWTYQVYLDKLYFPLEFFGLISASMTITQIVFSNLVHSFKERFKNSRRFLQIYTIIPGLGYIFMSLIYFTPVSIALILIVIGFGFTRSLIFVQGINKQIQSNNRATVISTVNMITCLIRTVLYPLVGILVMMNLNLTFISLGVIILIIGIFTRVKHKYLK